MRDKLLNLLLLISTFSMSIFGIFCASCTYEALHIYRQLSGKTGVLSRVEGIESQTNAIAINMKHATGNIAEATASWKSTSQQESAFITTALPAMTQQLHDALQQAQTTTNQMDTLAATLNAQAQHIGPAIDSIKEVADNTSPVLVRLNATVDASTLAIQHLDQSVNNPAVKQMMQNMSATTAHTDAMTADMQMKLHEFLYPPPCKGKKCWVLKVYHVADGVSKLSEPAYWSYSLFDAIRNH